MTDPPELHAHRLSPHTLRAANPQDAGNLQVGGPTRVFAAPGSGQAYNVSGSLVQMSPATLQPAGGDQSHNNRMPYLTLNFCIALQGVFPPRG